MKRLYLIDRVGLLVGVAGVLAAVTGCSTAPRPKALDDASAMLTDSGVNELQAFKPKLVGEANRYLRKATEAYDKGNVEDAALYAHMAMNRYLTAQNLVRSQAARRLAKEMVARRGGVEGEADLARSRQAELNRFRTLEERIAQINAALSAKPESDAPDVVAAKSALARARRKQAEAIGAGAPAGASAKYQQGSSLVSSAVESLELGIYSEARQSASQALVAFESAIAEAQVPKAAPPDASVAAKSEAEDALTDASSAQALALASGGPQLQPSAYQRGTILLSSAERGFEREDYRGAAKLARQAKNAFNDAAAGVATNPSPASMLPSIGVAGGTLFDPRPLDQILLSLRFQRATMLGEGKDATCSATFKEFEAIIELADERLKAGDTMSAREFVIRAQERLTKCGAPASAVAVAANKDAEMRDALLKQNAAAAIQKAQVGLATLRRTMPTDRRLAQPTALVANAERWFDRGSFTEAGDLANQAILALATIQATPTPPATKADRPEADLVKEEAAALLQKAQALHAELVAKLGDDKRLALPAQRLEAAERWYDGERFAQARDDARAALSLLVKLDNDSRAAQPAPTDGPKTAEQIAAEKAIEAARDARVQAIVRLAPDEKLKAPDKLLGLAEKALEDGRPKPALLYASKAAEEFLAASKAAPRVELAPDGSPPSPAEGENVCRKAFLKIAHAERLAANTAGSHLTPGERRQHDQGESLATIANMRLDEGKCDDAFALGMEAFEAVYPLPLRPPSAAAPRPKPKPSTKPKPGTKPKPRTKPKPGTKPTSGEPATVPAPNRAPTPPTAAAAGWKTAYDKTARALKLRDRAQSVVSEAMLPTFDRGRRALAAGQQAYEAKRYSAASMHADVATGQFEAVLAASSASPAPRGVSPRPRAPAPAAAVAPQPGPTPRAQPNAPKPAPAAAQRPGPAARPKPEAAWKAPYRAVFAALEMKKKATTTAKTEEAKKFVAAGDGEMAKAEASWNAKDYPAAQTHAMGAMVAYKLAIGDSAPVAAKEVSYKDADAALREARVVASVCERDKCGERDFQELEGAKQMLVSAEEAMKKTDYAYAQELATKAKEKMTAILDKPRPTAPKPDAVDPAAKKKAEDAISEAQIQERVCQSRECSKIDLEGWLRAANDLAAARSALADGDVDRAARLGDLAAGAFKGIEAPQPSVPTFSIPADVTSVSRAGSQLYVKPPIAFRTGNTLIDRNSKGSVDDLAKVLKANAALIKRVTIMGFTDNQGGSTLNKNISANRAKSVVKALVLNGVDQALITSEGRGEESPIADNATAEGRAANRRVEIHIELK